MADFVDKRGGAYDHVNAAGNPQPDQVRDKATSHQKAQWGADVRPERSRRRTRAIRCLKDCASREWVRSTRIRDGARRNSCGVGQ